MKNESRCNQAERGPLKNSGKENLNSLPDTLEQSKNNFGMTRGGCQQEIR